MSETKLNLEEIINVCNNNPYNNITFKGLDKIYEENNNNNSKNLQQNNTDNDIVPKVKNSKSTPIRQSLDISCNHNYRSSSNVHQRDSNNFQVINTEYENFDYENDYLQEGHNSHIKSVKKLSEGNEHIANNLNNDIERLHAKISEIQAKHHSDYLSTFNVFMETVKKDIKEKIEKMNIVEKEKEKNNNIQLVIAERDMFRQEAIRLNLLCKVQQEVNEQLKREKKFVISEMEQIIKKWHVSEDNNRKIIIELNNTVVMNKELEEKLRKLNMNNTNNDFSNNNFKNELLITSSGWRNNDKISKTNGFPSIFNSNNINSNVNSYYYNNINNNLNKNSTLNSIKDEYADMIGNYNSDNLKFDEFKKVSKEKFNTNIYNSILSKYS